MAPPVSAITPPDNQAPLDGATILRFAHAYESGGGTERYLEDLDRALLERNAMTVVRLHLTRNPSATQETQESIGRGQLIRVPLFVAPADPSRPETDEHSLRFRFKQQVRNWILYNPLVWRAVGAKWTARRRLPHRAAEARGAGNAAAAQMRARRVDLVMLHFFGGSDADDVATQARAQGVPFAVLNHYANDRFLHLAIRKHAEAANGVAGVNGLQVPGYLQHRFTNLSDGVDTAFFSAASAQPVPDGPPDPIILLPARVIREKGQLDLVRAVARLRDGGINCSLVFAGRVDTPEFLNELRREITRARLTESTRFLGGISAEALRNWYAASAVIAFPTYHHEGLGRVIIEAQAVGTPVIAYATGGVPDAIVSGTSGLLVRTGDIAGLTAGLRTLLASPSTRSAMAREGRRIAEQRFSLDALAQRHEEFYLRIIAEGRRDSRPMGS
jgi:glycosyltransferase involved in cell wall biosynthesis